MVRNSVCRPCEKMQHSDCAAVLHTIAEGGLRQHSYGLVGGFLRGGFNTGQASSWGQDFTVIGALIVLA